MVDNLRELVNKLNPVCRRTLEQAAALCVSSSHHDIEVEHWLIKLLDHKDNDFNLILNYFQVDHNQFRNELAEFIARLKSGNGQAPAFSPALVNLIREALIIANVEYGLTEIGSAAVLFALIQIGNSNPFTKGFVHYFNKIDYAFVKKNLEKLTQQSCEASPVLPLLPLTLSSSLNQYTVNLTELAKQGKIDPVIGRDEEIRQLIDILSRRRQNNPILTGEPGVGKTAVVEGLALRIINQQIPKNLCNVTVLSLDLGLLQAGAGIKGEFESRLKGIIHEIKNSLNPIILFIDEAHTLIGAGGQAGQADAANLLKPALARGELRTIAATTWGEYKKYFEQDAALARRFQVVKVAEPSEGITVQILRGLASQLEKHHHVRILDEALRAAVHFSNRYIPQRQLPDKAISVLDTACARLSISHYTDPDTIEKYQYQLSHAQIEIQLLEREQTLGANHSQRLKQLLNQQQIDFDHLKKLNHRLKEEKELIDKIKTLRFALENNVTSEAENLKSQLKLMQQKLHHIQGDQPLLQDCIDVQSIAEVISSWTGVPLGRMMNQEISTLLRLEKQLQARIKGQDHAIATIAKTIRTARAQLNDPRKPTGAFLFVGPSGVGKTETAISLAELIYGSDRNLTTINLSEFKEEHKVSLLLGSPPGYVGYGEGGILTEAVRRTPYSLVLLDELEKAHPGVQDIFYQVLDKGSLHDGQGRDINFKNTILILTSNAGSDLISKLCSDPNTTPDIDTLIEAIRPELLKFFKPAFLGRLTVIPYLPLSEEIMKQIIELQLEQIKQRVLMNYQAKTTFSNDITTYIINRCQEMESGARAIERFINLHLLHELSSQFLTRFESGKIIKKVAVELDNNKKFQISIK